MSDLSEIMVNLVELEAQVNPDLEELKVFEFNLC